MVTKKEKFDGRSRPANKAYDDNYDRIFGQKEIKELDESLKQSKANKKEHEKKYDAQEDIDKILKKIEERNGF
jgi:DNA-binding transcriptional regulator GbsR (MarR family)